ncbi:MAG: glycosyltransferase [Chloroflexota bacterium]
MKLLQVFDLFSPPRGGGTLAIVHNISRALARKGHEVVIYTSDFQLDPAYIKTLPEVEVHPFHCLSSVGNFFFTPGIIGEARRHLREFDIIHLQAFRSFQNLVVHHYARKYGVPYILDAHGSVLRTGRSRTNVKWLFKWFYDVVGGFSILRDAGKVITETEDGFKEYLKMGVPGDRVTRITPPFDIAAFSRLPAPGRFRENYGVTARHILLFLGRIHGIKGLGFLVESFGELSKTRDDTVLVIAGPDDGYRPTLEKLIDSLGISDKVVFTGFIGGEDKLAALVDADVVLQTSVYEQGTGVPFEAVLCGTPIIVSGHTVASANVRDIDAGYLVEYGNVSDLAGTIRYVLDKPAESRAKAKRAGEYIRANLSLEKGIERYEQLYAEVIASA